MHIVSLLNGTLDEKLGELLVSNVLETLTFLLSANDVSKVVSKLDFAILKCTLF